MTQNGSSGSDADRGNCIARLVAEVAERRLRGEPVREADIIDAHPELMPELEERLKALRRVEAGRKNAQVEAETSAEAVPAEASDIQMTLDAPAPPEPSRAHVSPDSIPGYQILSELHRGGQGVVYRAIQKSTKRKVAVKVMHEGPFAGPAEKARFEREVQILGQLKHPNIVTIYDSGSASGSFYFVMDYISGQSLDVYMAGREHSIDETLKLFGTICEAMNAAHLRGVIHRDLKPGNIRIDDEGQPYILDFGLAKVAASDAECHAMTMTGQFIGSLPWSSPEQAEAKPGKIDIRTDVYSLGVILYHMLTGKFPYDVIGNMRDVLDRIMKAEPARPSTIRRQINDEVETIVLKCLSKERARRYQSAGELARDIGHYLSGEPIEAKRDSVGYVLRKQLKRYKVVAAIAASFLLLITVGLLTTLGFWRQAAAERDRADEEREVALTAKDAETQARKAAEEQAVRATTVVELMRKMLASADPNMVAGGDYTVRQLLDDFADGLVLQR